MALRGLLRGVLMLVVGALVTWGVAGALQERAVATNSAAPEDAAPAVAASKSPASRWMF